MAVLKRHNGSTWEPSLVGGNGAVGGQGLQGNVGATGSRGTAGLMSPEWMHVRNSSRIRGMSWDPYLASTVTSRTPYVGYPNSAAITVIYVPEDATLNGMVVPMVTQGNFVGGGWANRIGLYKFNGSSLDMVAQSANDENIFKAPSGTAQLVPFLTPYVASAGIYYGAYLYSAISTTTQPVFPGMNASDGLWAVRDNSRVNNLFHSATSAVTYQDLPVTGLDYGNNMGSSSGGSIWMGVYE